jgi:hypothetical protein
MIHYHGMPMWPQTSMLRAMPTRHAFVSYERSEQIDAAVEICQSVALDNGTFPAWVKGVKYDPTGYRAWAGHWLRHPAVDWAVIPDVIDGDDATNDRLLEVWDLPIALSVPVYHMHERLARLERLVSTYPRVAIGSSGAFAKIGTRRWWDRMADVMRIACDETGLPRCKLHGLRQLDPVITSHVPYASADSTNAARSVAYDWRWVGPYQPASREVRMIVVMDRIERHASAYRWDRRSCGVQKNMDLLG